MADDVTLNSNYAGITCSFSQEELNAAAAQIQQQYAGNRQQMLVDFKSSLLPADALGSIPNANNVSTQMATFVDSVTLGLQAQGVDMAALASQVMVAAQLVEQANTQSARIAGQANQPA